MLDVALGALEARDRADVDHLVHRWRERDMCARHPGDARAPDSAGDHHRFGVDVTFSRAHAADAAVPDVDSRHLCLRRDVQRSRALAVLAHEGAHPQRVDDPHPRRIEAAENDRLFDVRDEVLHLGRRDERDGRDSPRLGRDHPSGELLHPLFGARHLDSARLDEHAILLVLADAVDRQRRHLLGVVDQVDEVRGVPGGSPRVRKRSFVEQHDVTPAEKAEVVRDAVADDAASDDDAAGVSWEPCHRYSGW